MGNDFSTADSGRIGWSASSATGVVAAGSANAVAAGLHMLNHDGNAADAAVATILALNVTDHGLCSIGGEVPLIIYDAASRSVKVLGGQGRAPLSRSAIDWYMKNGIPGPTDMKMAPVPAVVDLCVTALQRFGTKTFTEIIAPTLVLLDAGSEGWHPRLAHTLRRLVDAERRASGNRQERLQAVSDCFYGRNSVGDAIAEDLEADYIAKGSFLRRADLAAHKTPIEEPVMVDYRGYTVCKCGPWTQGPFLCQALRLLEGFDLKSMGHLSADYVHVVIEAIKLAMADRDEYYGDPDFSAIPLQALLSDAYTALRRPLIDRQRASGEARPGDPHAMKGLKGDGAYRLGIGGTTTVVVADRWGNVISATPSANVSRESDGGRTGVTFGNRLLSFNTTPGHPNCIQPGKRPRITLTPTLVLKDGKPAMAISVAGGDVQDQTALNLLLSAIEFGMSPEAAVTAPRFSTAHHQDSFNPDADRAKTFIKPRSLRINEAAGKEVGEELTRRGHLVEQTSAPIAVPVMLAIDRTSGMLRASGDPAANRHAAGM